MADEVDLDAIRERLEAADGWPWRYEKCGQMVFGRSAGGCNKVEDDYRVADIRGWGHLQYMGKTRGDDAAAALQDANGELVAHAPTDISALLALVDRLRASIAIKDKALEKLEWFGSRGFEECSWCGEYKTDGHAPNCLIDQALHTAERKDG